MSDDFPIRPWEHDHNEVDALLYQHGYHRLEGIEGVWQRGNEVPVTRVEALADIASSHD